MVPGWSEPVLIVMCGDSLDDDMEANVSHVVRQLRKVLVIGVKFWLVLTELL